MSLANETRAPLRNADRFFIGGDWVKPPSDAMTDVIDPGTEELFFRIAEAGPADTSRAVTAARQAFDEGPWPRMSHAQRAGYLRAVAAGLRERTEDIGQVWPRESGVLHKIARHGGAGAAATFGFYAGLAETYPFEEPATPTAGEFGAHRPRTGGRGRGDHPVERPEGADQQQDRSRPAGRMHRRPEVLLPFLETKTVILEGRPAGYEGTAG